MLCSILNMHHSTKLQRTLSELSTFTETRSAFFMELANFCPCGYVPCHFFGMIKKTRIQIRPNTRKYRSLTQKRTVVGQDIAINLQLLILLNIYLGIKQRNVGWWHMKLCNVSMVSHNQLEVQVSCAFLERESSIYNFRERKDDSISLLLYSRIIQGHHNLDLLFF